MYTKEEIAFAKTEKFFIFLGIRVGRSGKVYTTTLLGELMCKLLVREGKFKKIAEHKFIQIEK